MSHSKETRSIRTLAIITAVSLVVAILMGVIRTEIKADDTETGSGDEMTLMTSELTLPGGYDTTGLTQAEAICEVAINQAGIYAWDMDVTEGWCADFVYTCAKAAGIGSDVIPYTGWPQGIYNGILSGGGSVVQNATAGDIICYFYGDYCYHVGICINSEEAVNGNWGSDSDYTSYVAIAPFAYYDYMEQGVNYVILRPNYSDGSGGVSGGYQGADETNKGSTPDTPGDVLTRVYLSDEPDYDGNWYVRYNDDDKVAWGVTTVISNSYGWWYVRNGKVDFSFSGLAENDYGFWYIVNGSVDFSYTGVAKGTYGWWKVDNGQVNFDYNGLASNEYGWWYLEDGKVITDYNGIVRNDWGYWLVRDGEVRFDYWGIAQGQNGWWRIEAGKVNFDYTGLASNEYGWWYIRDGKADLSYNGIVENDYGYWVVINGEVRFDYNGIAQGTYGWWKIEGGQVNFDYTGLAANEYGWWYIENGAVNFDYTGLVENENGYWFVKDGAVQFSYSGLVQGNYGRYLVEGGKINWNYTGDYYAYGEYFYIVNGEVQE